MSTGAPVGAPEPNARRRLLTGRAAANAHAAIAVLTVIAILALFVQWQWFYLPLFGPAPIPRPNQVLLYWSIAMLALIGPIVGSFLASDRLQRRSYLKLLTAAIVGALVFSVPSIGAALVTQPTGTVNDPGRPACYGEEPADDPDCLGG